MPDADIRQNPLAPDPLTRHFILVARQQELCALSTTAHTTAFVIGVGDLIHALQKERGYSNLFACSPTEDALSALETLTHDAQQQQARFTDALQEQAADWRNARLLNTCAHALLRLGELPALRQGVRTRQAVHDALLHTFTRAIASLLNLVTEVMDGSPDPEIARQLVAWLNFMHSKELCGQERALGVSAFARPGPLDDAVAGNLHNLQQAQARSFASFEQFAQADALAQWHALRADESALVRLRAMALQRVQPHDPHLAHIWFDVCTARINAMHALELDLAQSLMRVCHERVAASQAELADHQQLTRRFVEEHRAPHTKPMLFSLQGRPLDVSDAPVGDGLSRTLLDLLQSQALRLQEADQALLAARRAQQERRQIEQVKWQLVRRYGLSEHEAHERLQRTAMNGGLSLLEVAQQLLRDFK